MARALLLLLVGGCSSVAVVSCDDSLPPPCDAATARQIEMSCFARVQTECVDKGVPEGSCEAIKECAALADARHERCKP